MKKILIVTTVPETLATILRSQPRFLSSHFKVFLASSPGPDACAVKEAEGIEIVPVQMTRGVSPVRDIVSILRMTKLIFRVRPDIVHSYTPKAGLVAMVAAAICRVEVRVHTFTGLIFPSRRGLAKSVLRAVDWVICQCATTVVPEGRGVRQELISNRVTKKPLDLIGHGNIAGVDVRHFSADLPEVVSATTAIREEFSIPSDAFVFCYVGRLNADKGIKELVNAFVCLSPAAHLIVLGKEDAEAAPSASVLRLLSEHPRIHRLGFRWDVRPAICSSNAVVLPSYREGFPNVLLEAAALGRASIATDISGCNEIVEQGVTGWLVEPKDVQSLRECMATAMGTSKLVLEAMGERARQRVVANFDREGHRERLLKFYLDKLPSEKANVAARRG